MKQYCVISFKDDLTTQKSEWYSSDTHWFMFTKNQDGVIFNGLGIEDYLKKIDPNKLTAIKEIIRNLSNLEYGIYALDNFEKQIILVKDSVAVNKGNIRWV